jgi:hypothetical protein
MILIIIKIVLIILAAICKAAVDTITHHPHTSKLWGKFWDVKIGPIVPYSRYRVNGWHLSNSLMIVCFIVAGVLPGYKWYYDIPTLGIIFILVFNLFYNKIFQYKKSVR